MAQAVTVQNAALPGRRFHLPSGGPAVGACWLLLAATIPLQWYSLIGGEAGILRPFHLAAVLFVAAYVVSRGSGRHVGRVIGSTTPFVVAILYWLVFVGAAQAYHRVSGAETFQQAAYALTALMVAGFFASLEPDSRCWRLVRWSALVALATFSVFFYRSAQAKGLDPFGLLTQAVTSGDTSVLQFSLFRPVFGETASVRHEVFASLLAMMWISVHAHGHAPLARTWKRNLYRLSIAGCAGAALVSVSRAVTLALLVGCSFSLVRSMLTGRMARRKAAVVFACAIALYLAFYSGFVELLVGRFLTETGSYSQRGAAVDSSLRSNPLVGSPGLETSPHNFILDSWVRAGLVSALAAVVAFAAVLVAWGRTIGEAMRAASGRTAVAALVTLPVIRLLTAGGGVLHLTEWLALAFLGGYLARHRRANPCAGTLKPESGGAVQVSAGRW